MSCADPGAERGNSTRCSYRAARRPPDGWDAATLDRFISAVAVAVPGTRMTYSGLNEPQRRAEVVAFLLSQRD